MAKLIIDDRRCRIVDEEDQGLLYALDLELSYDVQGGEHSRAYKHGYMNQFSGQFENWDGKNRLLEDSNLSFAIGLKERVINFYEKQNCPLEVIDRREPKSKGNPIDIFPVLKKLGKSPRPYQIDAMMATREHDYGIIRIPTGGGKCESIDSLHITENGLLDYEEMLDGIQLKEGEAIEYKQIVGTSVKFGKTEETSMIYRDGYGPSRKITTSFGYTQTATPNHKIQVISESGEVEWKKFENLKEGDYTVISYGNMMFGKNDMPLDEAYWYGLLFGDGSLTLDSTVALTNMDEHILNFSRKYLNDIGQDFNEYKTKSKATDIKIYSKQYRDSLISLGFKKEKSTDKTIPVSIRSLKREPLKMFLRGAFETDGWVGVEKSKPTVNIGLSNKKAIDQIHLLLLNFGIVASRRIKKTTHKDCHILTIYRGYLKSFIREIGFDPNGRKFKTLNDQLNKCGEQNSNITIPNLSLRLKSIADCISKEKKKECLVKWSTVFSWYGNGSWRRPTKKNLLMFLHWVHKNSSMDSHVQILVFNLLHDVLGVFFDKIKTIEETKSDNYDFVVPKTHSFVSQGFVNHNTLVATLITADIGKKTIVYVIGKDLLHQLYGFFQKVFSNIKIGIIGDGLCEIGDINVASVWTVGQAIGLSGGQIFTESVSDEKNVEKDKYDKIRDLIMETKVHIIDECHVSACDTIQQLSYHINPEHVYGMSASPWRDDNADLLIEAILGSKIVDISATQLIDEDYLVQPLIKFVRVPQYHKRLKKNYNSIYKTYVTENDIRNNLVLEYTEKLVDLGYRPLILYNSVRHGKILHDLISKKVPCTLLSGKDKMKVREQAKQDIENGKIKAIIASKIFDIGVDIPALSGLIVAGSGKSSVRALQRIGRVIRPYPDKQHAAVVDFIDQTHYLKQHSQARKNIYSLEKGFKVKWPKMK